MLWHSTSRLLGLITIGLLIIFLATRSPWRHKIFKPIDSVPNDAEALCASVDQTARSDPEWHLRPPILPGVQVSSEQHHSKMLVVAAVHYNDTDWIRERLPNIQTAIYVAEDPSARLQPPKNKGNEVMIYLTYIIDHYDELCDITVFMHSHQFSWHNNPVLNFNAYEMLTRLNHDRVSREGYMNLRCDWFPGCPDWIHPGHVQEEGMQNGRLAECGTSCSRSMTCPQFSPSPAVANLLSRGHAFLRSQRQGSFFSVTGSWRRISRIVSLDAFGSIYGNMCFWERLSTVRASTLAIATVMESALKTIRCWMNGWS
jgi:Protein of unknown function (DUF3431)